MYVHCLLHMDLHAHLSERSEYVRQLNQRLSLKLQIAYKHAFRQFQHSINLIAFYYYFSLNEGENADDTMYLCVVCVHNKMQMMEQNYRPKRPLKSDGTLDLNRRQK